MNAKELTRGGKGRETSNLDIGDQESKKQKEKQLFETYAIVVFVAQILVISYGSTM